jgi:hypothetical protein
MARISGTDIGFHVLATSFAVFSASYCTIKAYRFQRPEGAIRRAFFFLWYPLIIALFFFGLHEGIFNPLYYSANYFLDGRQQAVIALLSDTEYTVRGFLTIEMVSMFFGLVYLWKYLKLNVMAWLPFLTLCVLWFSIGVPVTVSVIPPETINNALYRNVIESLYTGTFAIGFCGAFK